jgi:hypothetical protein
MLLNTENSVRLVFSSGGSIFKLEVFHGNVNLDKECLTTEEVKKHYYPQIMRDRLFLI